MPEASGADEVIRECADRIENVYTLKVLNMDQRPIAMTSTPRGSPNRTCLRTGRSRGRPARSSRSRCA